MVKRLLAVYTYLSCGLFAFTISGQAQPVKWSFFAMPVNDREVKITDTTRPEDRGDLYAHGIAEGGPLLKSLLALAFEGGNDSDGSKGLAVSKTNEDHTLQYRRMPLVPSLARIMRRTYLKNTFWEFSLSLPILRHCLFCPDYLLYELQKPSRIMAKYFENSSKSIFEIGSSNMLIGLGVLTVIIIVSLVWLCNACLLQEGKRLQSTSAPVKLLLCLINGCHTGVVLHYTKPQT